jgi:hypothetical protein
MKKYEFPDPKYYSKIETRIKQGEYRIVNGRLACEVCSANCGQCGDTDVLGNFTDGQKMGGLVKNFFKNRSDKPNIIERDRLNKWLKAYKAYCESKKE